MSKIGPKSSKMAKIGKKRLIERKSLSKMDFLAIIIDPERLGVDLMNGALKFGYATM